MKTNAYQEQWDAIRQEVREGLMRALDIIHAPAGDPFYQVRFEAAVSNEALEAQLLDVALALQWTAYKSTERRGAVQVGHVEIYVFHEECRRGCLIMVTITNDPARVAISFIGWPLIPFMLKQGGLEEYSPKDEEESPEMEVGACREFALV